MIVLALLACARPPVGTAPAPPAVSDEPISLMRGPAVRDQAALLDWLERHIDTKRIVRLPVRLQPGPMSWYDGGWLGDIRVELDDLRLGIPLDDRGREYCHPDYPWASPRQVRKMAEDETCSVWVDGTLTRHDTSFDLRVLLYAVSGPAPTPLDQRPVVTGAAEAPARDATPFSWP
ncbi:MAG: hypothetical protein AAF602_10305 [Myxococcota bacterium]